jgi:hypothetical protein
VKATSRSVKVYTRPSSEIVHDVASSGSIELASPSGKVTSVS